ncbi:MAG: hypothetical protein KGI00_05535, partial [Candidatus Micrarchaeota archaeon]|nr:hypothetical protein [Candidatus Micrarchaeota archaeon]
MRTKNAKRIAAVAASLLMGLAFAGQGVTVGNIPIINSQGQPVVQIVVGGTSAPSDGVVAGNIAAVIGNLAFTSTNVTATVATSGVNCVVTTPTCTISNAQVWLGESGTSVPASSYGVYALIGSVLNQAIPLNVPDSTKQLQSGAGTQYAFQELLSLSISPVASPYTALGSVPIGTTASASSNGGGAQFSGFSVSSGGSTWDNILEVTNSNFPSLANNWGAQGEAEYLWVTGFPVFDQASNINNFRLLSAGGAYQATFNKPIQNRTTSNGLSINVPIKLLGKNYTILSMQGGAAASVGSGNTVNGGRIQLASTLVPAQVVYVGHNMTTGPWTVQLQDLGQPTSGGVSTASVAIYYNGQLTNTTSIFPGNTVQFNYTGHNVYVNVQSTFAGLYAYQKWAKMQVYSNLLNISDGKVFNQTNDPGWYVRLYWTNTTLASAGNAVALKSIVVYNNSPTDLAPEQSVNFIQNPTAFKLTFVGDSLSSAQYDTVTASTSASSSVQYQNLVSGSQGGGQPKITNITEPVQYLTVTSSIPNSLSYAGQTSSSVSFDLTPYELYNLANALGNTGGNQVVIGHGANSDVSNVVLEYDGANALGWINGANPLTVTVTGYTSNTAASTQSSAVTFTSNSANALAALNFYNVTGITLSRALPANVIVSVYSNSINGLAGGPYNGVILAQLVNVPLNGGAVLYGPLAGQTYYSASTTAVGNVIYNSQNGQATTTWALSGTGAAGYVATTSKNPAQAQYFTFSMNSLAVSTNTAALGAFAFGIVNSSAGVGSSPMFSLNYSASFNSNTVGTARNVTYVPSGETGKTAFNVRAGFKGERGSGPTSISSSTLSFSFAKLPDTLLFTVGLANTTAANTSQKLYGPYGVGQATNLANVTIGKVNATCTGGSGASSSCTVTGLANLTATPSVTQAV